MPGLEGSIEGGQIKLGLVGCALLILDIVVVIVVVVVTVIPVVSGDFVPSNIFPSDDH